MFRTGIAALLLACTSVGSGAAAQDNMAPQAASAFALDPLPYAVDALAPIIDAETMKLHHGFHHKAYVDNLNKALAADPALAGQSLEALLARASQLPKTVRDNAGGHWNHRFFWPLMAPEGQRGQPSAALQAAITQQFGSMEKFQAAFQQAGLGQFGSGWAWLIVRPDGKLAVTATPNQDNPLMDVVPEPQRGIPILGNDVWEHAYYLTYRNRRGEYLSQWWELVNWNQVDSHYVAALKKR